MSTTSMDMQPARATASNCTGEGPALLSPSTISAFDPAVAPNSRAWDQIRSTATGGFSDIPSFCTHGGQVRTGDSARTDRRLAREIGAVRGRMPSAVRVPPENRDEQEPPEGKGHQSIAEVGTIPPLGTIRLRRPMERLAVGEQVGFGQLVDAVDDE